MTAVALALLAFGAADLVRWSPDRVSRERALAAVTIAAAITTVLAALCGWSTAQIILAAVLSISVITAWVLTDYLDHRRAPRRQWAPAASLGFVLVVMLVLLATSGSTPVTAGRLASWYSGLDVSFAGTVPAQQFLVALGGLVFLLSTANRLVRLVLEASSTPAATGESTLRGGRVLGWMERLVVAALLVGGETGGAAVVIAAKGLLRLPEIRSREETKHGAPDQVTEYFLIGTFSSLLLAAVVALLVLAAGGPVGPSPLVFGP